jgi:hypothetical protein
MKTMTSRVLDWFESVAGAEFFVSALTMMEIEIGARRLERHDRRQAKVVRAWEEGPAQTKFRRRFANVDLEIAERCAALLVPDPQPKIDTP